MGTPLGHNVLRDGIEDLSVPHSGRVGLDDYEGRLFRRAGDPASGFGRSARRVNNELDRKRERLFCRGIVMTDFRQRGVEPFYLPRWIREIPMRPIDTVTDIVDEDLLAFIDRIYIFRIG
ncbi:MAG: hypothetical protein Q9184_006909 [Pyrenodesmia sp. 2 TL-2023]